MQLSRCPICVACIGMSGVEAMRQAHLVTQKTANANVKQFRHNDIAKRNKGLIVKVCATTYDAFFESKLAGAPCRM